MIVAITAQGDSPDAMMDSRFGRASYFLLHDTNSGEYEVLSNTQNLHSVQGAGIQAASTVVNAGCDALITGHCGPKAFTALKKAGVEVYAGCSGKIAEIIEKFKNGSLQKSTQADVEGHW
ncbi:MAG: NifB/NifX family molybdenum-iron cluster-binding protein [Chitinivibrionales bacterium]